MAAVTSSENDLFDPYSVAIDPFSFMIAKVSFSSLDAISVVNHKRP